MSLFCAAILLSALQADDPFDSRRPEAREGMLERGGGTKESEAAVRKALEWLSKNQKADGTWQAPEKDADLGVTALSVLAFLGSGHRPNSETFGDPIRRGLKALLAAQDAEGCVGDGAPKYMYGHLLATMALAEAHAMSSPETYGKAAQKAVDFLVASQNPGKGWRYAQKCGDNDTSVTGWAVLALRSAERARLGFRKSTYEGALAWFDEVTDDRGLTGYNQRNRGALSIPSLKDNFDYHESMTAMAVLAKFLMVKHRKDHWPTPRLELVGKDLPRWEKKSMDFYYWHVATRAMFEAGDIEGPLWKSWNQALLKALLPHQVPAGEHAGSWDPVDYGSLDGGRVYATAINALTLETYYRYVLRFRGDEK